MSEPLLLPQWAASRRVEAQVRAGMPTNHWNIPLLPRGYVPPHNGWLRLGMVDVSEKWRTIEPPGDYGWTGLDEAIENLKPDMAGEHTIWVMESDLCEDCDTLLDMFGCCPNCGWGELDDLYVDDDEDDLDLDEYALDFDEQGRYIGG